MSTKEQRERIELLQGTLDLLILRTLLLGPAHGHAIAKAIEFNSDDVLQVEQGSLYPALHRLIKRGWISVGRRHLGEQSPGQVLPADGQGAAATGRRDQQVGQAGGSDRADSPAGGTGGRIMKRRKRMMEDLDQDIREHIEMETQDNIERGMSPEEARYAALRKFGNVTRVKEETRDVWSFAWLEQLWQDMRYAVRMLRKSPGFTAIAVLTIALGIGATTAIFSVVDATLLHPLPYPQPEQLVSIQDDLPGVGAQDVGMSVPEWQDLQRSGIFQYVSPVGGGSVNLTGSSQPARIFFAAVPPNYFALLGVKPQLGHSFNPEDHTPGFTLEVLISDGLWKGAFGGDPHILGRSVRLDNDLYQIIGVMPAGYHDPGRTTDERNIEVWAATGFAGPPAPPPLRKSQLSSAGNRANRTWTDDCGGAEPGRRVGCIFAEAIPG